MKENKQIYYDIYSEFNNINKFRELKSIRHHGDNRLNHINRVAKLSFHISKKLGLDYISCTRGAIMHDFFTTDDINKQDNKYRTFLKKHPVEALTNSMKYFEVNDIEEDIILSHMYPITKRKPEYVESKIVCIADKLISFYEFFRFETKSSVCFAYMMCVRLILLKF